MDLTTSGGVETSVEVVHVVICNAAVPQYHPTDEANKAGSKTADITRYNEPHCTVFTAHTVYTPGSIHSAQDIPMRDQCYGSLFLLFWAFLLQWPGTTGANDTTAPSLS